MSDETETPTASTAVVAAPAAPVAPVEPEAAPVAPARAPDACPRCGAPLRDDQEWCLNCGAAARTRVAAPAGWRAPVAIVGGVLALALTGLILAFLAISDDSDELLRQAQTAGVPTPTPAPGQTPPPPPASTPAPEATPAPETSPVPTITPAPGEPGSDPNAGLPPASETEDPATTPDPGADTPADPGTDSGGGGTIGSWPAGEDAFTVVLASSPTRAAARRRAQQLAGSGVEVGVLDSDEFKSLRGGYWVVFSGQYDSRDAAESAAEGLEDQAPGAYVRKVTPR